MQNMIMNQNQVIKENQPANTENKSEKKNGKRE